MKLRRMNYRKYPCGPLRRKFLKYTKPPKKYDSSSLRKNNLFTNQRVFGLDNALGYYLRAKFSKYGNDYRALWERPSKELGSKIKIFFKLNIKKHRQVFNKSLSFSKKKKTKKTHTRFPYFPYWYFYKYYSPKNQRCVYSFNNSGKWLFRRKKELEIFNITIRKKSKYFFFTKKTKITRLKQLIVHGLTPNHVKQTRLSTSRRKYSLFNFSRNSLKMLLTSKLKKQKQQLSHIKNPTQHPYFVELNPPVFFFTKKYEAVNLINYPKTELLRSTNCLNFITIRVCLSSLFAILAGPKKILNLNNIWALLNDSGVTNGLSHRLKKLSKLKNIFSIRFDYSLRLNFNCVVKQKNYNLKTKNNKIKYLFNVGVKLAHYFVFLREFRPLKKRFRNNYLSDLGYRRFLNNPTFQINKYSRNLSLAVSKVVNSSNASYSFKNLYSIILKPYYDFAQYFLSNKFSKKIHNKSKCFNILNFKIVSLLVCREDQLNYYFFYHKKKTNKHTTGCVNRVGKFSFIKKSNNKFNKLLFLFKVRNSFNKVFFRSIPLRLNLYSKNKHGYWLNPYSNKKYSEKLKNILNLNDTNFKLSIGNYTYLKKSIKKLKLFLKFRGLAFKKKFKIKRKYFFFRKFKKLIKLNKFNFYLNTTNRFTTHPTKFKSYRVGGFNGLKNSNKFTSATNLKNYNNLNTELSKINPRNSELVKSWGGFSSGILNNYLLHLFLINPFVFKMYLPTGNGLNTRGILNFFRYINSYFNKRGPIFTEKINFNLNLTPDKVFTYRNFRHVFNLSDTDNFRLLVTPWYYNTVIRFLEFFSGKKVLIQFYHFLSQNLDLNYIILYRTWLPRMRYYERKLGHRFFLEESIHIMHLSFFFKDVKLFMSWLKSLIQRISFWRTRSIFRFIKYLYQHYFSFAFPLIGLKGIKIKLKGKVSAAGNSRKRTVFYKWGRVSHSSVNLKVLYDFQTISTFTGVQGLQVWLFY